MEHGPVGPEEIQPDQEAHRLGLDNPVGGHGILRGLEEGRMKKGSERFHEILGELLHRERLRGRVRPRSDDGGRLEEAWNSTTLLPPSEDAELKMSDKTGQNWCRRRESNPENCCKNNGLECIQVV